MTFEIDFFEDNHPGCFDKECEETHTQKNIHISTDYFTYILVEGSKEWEFINSILNKFLTEEEFSQKEFKKIRVLNKKCKCGEQFMIEQILTELHKGMIQHKKNNCKLNK